MYILTITIIAVIGAIAVAKGKPLIANSLWIISNPLMAYYNYELGEIELTGMFIIYFVISLYGVWHLKVKSILLKIIDDN